MRVDQPELREQRRNHLVGLAPARPVQHLITRRQSVALPLHWSHWSWLELQQLTFPQILHPNPDPSCKNKANPPERWKECKPFLACLQVGFSLVLSVHIDIIILGGSIKTFHLQQYMNNYKNIEDLY